MGRQSRLLMSWQLLLWWVHAGGLIMLLLLLLLLIPVEPMMPQRTCEDRLTSEVLLGLVSLLLNLPQPLIQVRH